MIPTVLPPLFLSPSHIIYFIVQEHPSSPEVTTFTVFFIAFTAVVGKELTDLSLDDAMLNNKRTIMSTYFHQSHAYGASDDCSSGDSDLSTGTDSNSSNNSKSNTSNNIHISSAGSNGGDVKKKENASKGRERFHDSLTKLEIEEAKATAKAQLGLAFEMLIAMKERNLKTDPVAFRSLIDACGRCGDIERATSLLARMHDDGIEADGVVYSCLVSAFSAENAWRRVTNTSKLNLPGKIHQLLHTCLHNQSTYIVLIIFSPIAICIYM